ncbi:MAG TPA: M48 family metallopeptidase [Myxococcaceae bacterium]|nr:M48 family metallopeptidase [Myxococcaceae bacterium]
MTSPGRPATASWLVALSIVTLGGAFCQASGAASSPDQRKQTVASQASPYYPVTLPDGGTQDLELLIGQEAYQELKAKGEIVASSPLYDTLRPIADRITRAAQPQYAYPFRFYLVHESQPNAFSVPGGNLYVVDALLFFVKNQEELAGTLCHEVAHTIHHDSMNKLAQEYRQTVGDLGVAILLGPTPARVLAIALLSKLGSLSYSREVETSADLTGADICASAGLNPWGLVWLFQDFKDSRPNEGPELLSDHPNDEHRIQALKNHFKQNPEVFGKFNSDPRAATVMKLPADTAETFVR